MTNKSEKDMLVSDEWLDAEEGADFNAEMDFTGEEKIADLSSTKWRAGAECIRAIYEPELTKLRSERDELVVALGAMIAPRVGSDKKAQLAAARQNARSILAKHKPE